MKNTEIIASLESQRLTTAATVKKNKTKNNPLILAFFTIMSARDDDALHYFIPHFSELC